MAVDSLGAVASSTSSAVTQNSNLSQQDFLKILLQQLTFQDPLKPVDNEAFIAQLAQFTSLEQTRELNTRVDNLLTIQSSSQSVSLLGRTVDIATNSASATGQVTTVTFSNGEPLMTVKTTDGAFLTGVTLSQVSAVR